MANVLAPASPAETAVVVPWYGHQLVGRDADAGGEHVRMQVDEAGYDEPSGRVEHAIGACSRDIGLHGLDLAETHSDVAPGAQALAGIEHLAALDDEVELVVRPHRGARRQADRARGECRPNACHQLPALERSHVAPSLIDIAAA